MCTHCVYGLNCEMESILSYERTASRHAPSTVYQPLTYSTIEGENTRPSSFQKQPMSNMGSATPERTGDPNYAGGRNKLHISSESSKSFCFVNYM